MVPGTGSLKMVAEVLRYLPAMAEGWDVLALIASIGALPARLAADWPTSGMPSVAGMVQSQDSWFFGRRPLGSKTSTR